MKNRDKKILGATLGHDVHVAGVLRFLRLAEEHGLRLNFRASSRLGGYHTSGYRI